MPTHPQKARIRDSEHLQRVATHNAADWDKVHPSWLHSHTIIVRNSQLRFRHPHLH